MRKLGTGEKLGPTTFNNYSTSTQIHFLNVSAKLIECPPKTDFNSHRRERDADLVTPNLQNSSLNKHGSRPAYSLLYFTPLQDPGLLHTTGNTPPGLTHSQLSLRSRQRKSDAKASEAV